MYQTWSWLSFLHWSYPPEVVQRLLPSRLRVHDFDGRAWVGLTPFVLGDLRTPVPRRRPGSRGSPRPTSAPMSWAPTDATGSGSSRWTRPGCSRCRWPGPRPASLAVTVEVGPRLAPEELDQFDHHLTARWQLYTTLGLVLARTDVEHEPWPLHRAAVRELRGNLVTAAGLPEPDGPPVAHRSPGVRTRISGLRPLGRA